MAEPFIGEIRPFAFPFAPRYWAFCDGQTMAIAQNQALFSLLGTTFGGNGVSNFNLPDLRGRVPIHAGPAYPLGGQAGEETHALTTAEMPAHSHVVQGTTAAIATATPSGNLFGATTPAVGPIYKSGPANRVAMNAAAIANGGGGQGHPNMQPYLTLNFAIALQGVFPSRN